MSTPKLTYAIQYLRARLSIVPTHANKRPSVDAWREWQKTPMSEQDAPRYIAESNGIALIGGAVSEGLECIDVDCKYDLTGKLWQSFSDALKALPNDLYDRLTIQQTQNGGYHVIYRCPVVEGNQKLAERPSTQDETDKKNAEILAWNDANPTLKQKKTIAEAPAKVLIETRGEGGYFLVYPSEGYKFIQRNPLHIETITAEERTMLFDCARLYNEEKPRAQQGASHIQQGATYSQKPASQQYTAAATKDRPGDQFDDAHSAFDVLDAGVGAYQQGWGTDSKGRKGIKICNSPNGEYNGFYYPDDNKVFVFSPNYGIPIETALLPHQLYAFLHHRGDFSAAARDLASKGFGSQRSKPQQQPKPRPQEQPMHSEPIAVSDGHGLESNPYFRVLGFDKTDSGVQAFYFFRKGCNTLIRLTASSMSKNNLMTLAPLPWWEGNFEGRKGSMDVDAAANWLIQTGSRAGHFRTTKVRGRGAWLDDKRVVIHTGDKLIVDGVECAFEAHRSPFIYESSEELGIGTSRPLSTEQSAEFLKLCNKVAWARPVNGTLLAGWCVVAPVCGALSWRPHLWITGESGTGKSTVFRNIVKRMLGQTAIGVQGNTSESGLRQTLKFDALPVVFDEAEAEDKASQERMAQVLALMRASSSDDGGKIIKGGQDGQAKQYDIRSCFAYASIVFQATQQSDQRRITVLETKKLHDRAKATDLIKDLNAKFATLTPDYVASFQARTVKLLPTILENAKVFARAVVEVIGQQWAGDQLGILLAGAYSLQHDDICPYETAIAYVSAQDWSEELGLDKSTDQLRLLAKIAEQQIRDGMIQRTVGELIIVAAGIDYDDAFNEKAANDLLKRIGIKIEGGEVVISNTADWVKKTLAGTPWASNHSKVLMRLEGARAVENTRFAAIRGRAIALPINLFAE